MLVFLRQTLDGDRVNVTFRVENTWIGDQTQATIQIKTILGQKFLSLNPRGSARAGLLPAAPFMTGAGFSCATAP